jgi:hypothetical protein
MLVSIIAIIKLYYVVIYRCFDCGWVCFISTPIWFLMEQLHCSEAVVAMFYNVLFYVFIGLVFFILWVYPPLAFLRLASLCVRLQSK